MKREATKIAERIREQTDKLRSIETQPILQSSHRSKTNKRIKKIEDLNRKIRRVRSSKKKLIAKRDALKLQLVDLNPRLIEGAFGEAYGKYRIDGVEGMDLPTFFSKTKDSIVSVLKRESARRAIHSQTATWIRFMKGSEYVDLAFNSRMTPVYVLNDIDSLVRSMIDHIGRDPQRVSKLRRYDDFDWTGINFPVSTKDISKFELRNRIGVNVLVLHGKTPYICRKGGDYDRVVNLMIIEDGDKRHYVAIKSLGRLLSKMNNKQKNDSTLL